MKIRNSSRITAIVLALVMLLPLISIPTFAEETVAKSPSWSENFDGKALADVTNGTFPNLAAVNDAGNLKLGLSANPQYTYYLWQDSNNKWPIANAIVDADDKVSGTANNITISASTVNETSCSTAATVVSGGTEGVSYYVVTGAYADSVGGFCGNVGHTLKLNNTAFTSTDGSVVISMDVKFPVGSKTSSIQGRIGTNAGATLELFKLVPNGTNVTIKARDNAKYTSGAETTVSQGEWFTIAYVVDMTTAACKVFVNGTMIAKQINTSAINKAINLTANTLQVEIARGQTPDKHSGEVLFDNVQMYVGELEGGFVFVDEDFEDYNTGSFSTSSGNTFNSLVSGTTIVESDDGNKTLQYDYKHVSNGNSSNINSDAGSYLKHDQISYADLENLVFEMDYFFPMNATGQFQVQIQSCTANGNTTYSWVDLYQIKLGDALATLKFESAYHNDELKVTSTMKKGEWNTVSCMLNLKTGRYNVAINNNPVIANIPLYRSAELKNVIIGANKFLIGKVNKEVGVGTLQIDNIKLFEGTQPTGGYQLPDWTENFDGVTAIPGISIPSSATLISGENGNKSVQINLGSSMTGEAGFNFVIYESRVMNVDTTVNNDAPIKTGDVYKNVAFKDETTGKYYSMSNCKTRSIEFTMNDNGTITITSYHCYGKNSDDNEVVYPSEDQMLDGLKLYHSGDKKSNLTGEVLAVRNSTATIWNTNTALECGGIGLGNIDKMFKIGETGFNSAYAPKVVLTAKYFVSTDAKGKFESQLQNSTIKFKGLYEVDCTNSTIKGVSFNKGEWFTVSVVLDLKNGGYGEVYLNNMYIGTTGQEIPANALSAGNTWSVGKVMKTSDPTSLGGSFMIDDLSISATVPTSGIDGILNEAAFSAGLVSTLGVTSIRLKAPTGLRFISQVDDSKIQILEKLVADGKIKSFTMGTLIAPRDYVMAANCVFTKDALEALADEKGYDAPYLDVAFGGEYYQGEAPWEGDFMTASIVNIKAGNIAREFDAIAYVEITLNDGSVKTIYSNGSTIDSVQECAKSALEDTSANWSESEKAVLNAYAAGNQPE